MFTSVFGISIKYETWDHQDSLPVYIAGSYDFHTAYIGNRQLRGVRPFLSNKYDITKHKRYKELADFNKNNAFDVEKYLAHRLVMSKDTEFEMYEVTVTQEDVSAIEAEEGED